MDPNFYRLDEIHKIEKGLNEEKLKHSAMIKKYHCLLNFCTGCLLIFQFCMFHLKVVFLSDFEEIIGTISGKVLHQACTTYCPRATCGPRDLFFRPARTQLQKMLQKPNFGLLLVLSEFLPHYDEIDFCGPRRVYVDQFGPSSFLSCAGLFYLD